ncbi:uncharacterized protein APUU_30706A [Aspergillus puulaauensis]|uniref:Mid2 domain-containing protein n=1 Tax=Aspergillus puulaauensis TaxID=1220207 RepID=A0A7R8AKQ5_9EURO|nr:uncharacterized protein APUU_30706A [Aspergillus puulaauensis]BCS22481.1 hypothetical protein APUU_30706A [Aspergillus puulaauensis]
MTSHGVSKHGRYERLLRKHRLDTRANGGQEPTVVGDQPATPGQTARPKNLHEGWAALREKRQQGDSPSNIPVLPNPQTMDTADSDPVPTTATEKAPAAEPTSISDSNQEAAQAPTTTDSGDALTTVTAVTKVTTIVPYPTEDATADSVTEEAATGTATDEDVTEPAFEPTSTLTNLQMAAAAETASNTDTPAEQTSAEASTEAATEPGNESGKEPAEQPATAPSPTESASAATPTAATTEDPTESAIDGSSVAESLSEAATEAIGILTSLSSDIASITASTNDIPPTSDPNSTPTASATVTASDSIISRPSDSTNNTPDFIGSSLHLATAMASPQSPSETSTQSILGIASSSNSSSSSDTNTDSTDSTTASTPTSSVTCPTTTTASNTFDTSDTSYSDSPSYTSSGWGSGNSNSGGGDRNSDNTGASPGSNSSSDSGSGSISPQTTGRIVGGVVGGVAGASIIFVLIWFLLRRRRKTGFFFGSPANRSIADDGGGGGLIGPVASPRREMVSRDSNKDSMFGATYFAPAFMKRWRQSQMSTGEESLASTAPSSERGFQKVSGRKLPTGMHPDDFDYSSSYGGGSFLEAGSPTDPTPDLSPTLPPVIPRSGFPSHQPPPPSNPFSAPLDSRYTREAPEEDVVVMRPSPARIPTSGSANATTWTEGTARTSGMPMAFPMPPSGSGPIAIPKRPDALGRSHPSYDGSRGSRFTESL